MDLPVKSRLGNVLFLAAAFVAGMATVLRLLSEDTVVPGTTRLVSFAAAVVCASLIGIRAMLTGRLRLRMFAVAIPATLFMALALALAVFTDPLPFQGIAHAFDLAGTLLLFLVIVQTGSDREFSKLLVKSALGVAIVQTVIGLHQFYAPGQNGATGMFQGTHGNSAQMAGMLAVMIPLTVGLLLNAVHEKLDRSVWPRRLLYALATVVFSGGLLYAGSEMAWLCLLLGMAGGLTLTGRTYLARNRAVVFGTAAVLIALVGASVTFQTLSGFRIPGYGKLPEQLAPALESGLDDARQIQQSPMIGIGAGEAGERSTTPADLADPRDRLAPQALAIRNSGGEPSFTRIAALYGIPAALGLLGLIVVSGVLIVRGLRCPSIDPIDEAVIVGNRRQVKAVDLAFLSLLGGVLAFFIGVRDIDTLSKTAILVACLPVWVAVVSISFSYKHFRKIVENQRDFVAIGAATGACVGLLLAVTTGALLHGPSRFLIFLLLAVAVSRTLPETAGPVVDLRFPKFLRPALGIAILLVGLAGVVVAIAGFVPEGMRVRLEETSPDLPHRKSLSSVRWGERARHFEKIGRLYRVDAAAWTRSGEARLAQALVLSDTASGKLGPLEERARKAFDQSRRFSTSPALRTREGWAWLRHAKDVEGRQIALLERAREAFSIALKKEPHSALACYGLGEVLFQAGESDRAREFLNRALEHSETARPSLRLTRLQTATILGRLAILAAQFRHQGEKAR